MIWELGHDVDQMTRCGGRGTDDEGTRGAWTAGTGDLDQDQDTRVSRDKSDKGSWIRNVAWDDYVSTVARALEE